MTFPEQLVVNVTDEDINKGRPGIAESCAIARAVRRELKLADPDYVEVEDDINVSLWDPDSESFLGADARYEMTAASKDFVTQYDKWGIGEGAKPSPATFTFNLVKLPTIEFVAVPA